mmetsp:Transcript_21319/g.3456  ORF Transcript_21319/g.3456 Transcript_21319/m.3456 type:complete len:105 (+) Transcript_21319:1982-2296(+)
MYYIKFWMQDTAVFSRMVQKSIKDIGAYLLVLSIPFVGFVLTFKYSFGPYIHEFSRLDKCYLNLIRLFLGSYSGNSTFTKSVDAWYFIFVILSFSVYRMIVFSL